MQKAILPSVLLLFLLCGCVSQPAANPSVNSPLNLPTPSPSSDVSVGLVFTAVPASLSTLDAVFSNFSVDIDGVATLPSGLPQKINSNFGAAAGVPLWFSVPKGQLTKLAFSFEASAQSNGKKVSFPFSRIFLPLTQDLMGGEVFVVNVLAAESLHPTADGRAVFLPVFEVFLEKSEQNHVLIFSAGMDEQGEMRKDFRLPSSLTFVVSPSSSSAGGSGGPVSIMVDIVPPEIPLR